MSRQTKRVLCIGTLAAIGGAFVFRPAPVERTSGPLPHQGYIWQRVWTNAVRAAVDRSRVPMSGYVVLGAEVSWDRGQPRVARVPVDYPALRSAMAPVGIALRIGAYPGPFTADGDTTSLLAGVARSLVADAAAAGVTPREVQVDFDCPESKLDGYRTWVEVLRRTVAPVPLTITALPSWLDRGAFGRLVAAADGFVLQVHSFEQPRSVDTPLVLCDPDAARRAVEHAAGLGRPFRVALPTYGYVAAFDPQGRFIGLSAEGPSPQWPEGTHLREVRADPAAMADLVRGWQADRPKALQGLLWYRIPTEEDLMNWRWATLARVIEGRAPSPDLRIEARHPQPGLVELDVVNRGDADAAVPEVVRARWRDARRLAADGLNGFACVVAGPSEFRLRRPSTAILARLHPGDRKIVGWLRLDAEREVETDVISSAAR